MIFGFDGHLLSVVVCQTEPTELSGLLISIKILGNLSQCALKLFLPAE